MKKPNCLFKFCHADGAEKILGFESLFITSPLDLNDPFEMRPAWTDAHESRFFRDQETRNRLAEGVPHLCGDERWGYRKDGTNAAAKRPCKHKGGNAAWPGCPAQPADLQGTSPPVPRFELLAIPAS